MTFDEFIQLTHEDQLDAIKKLGSFIGEKKIEGQRMVLYQMHSFYVEVCRDDHEQVTKLRAFSSIDLLDTYLDDIDIFRITKKLLFVPLTNLLEIIEPFLLGVV